RNRQVAFSRQQFLVLYRRAPLLDGDDDGRARWRDRARDFSSPPCRFVARDTGFASRRTSRTRKARPFRELIEHGLEIGVGGGLTNGPCLRCEEWTNVLR